MTERRVQKVRRRGNADQALDKVLMGGQAARGRFAQGDIFQRVQIAEKAAGCCLHHAGTTVGHCFDAASKGGRLRQVASNVYQDSVNGLALSSGRQAAKLRQP